MPNKEEQKQISALRRRRKLRQLLGAVVCVLVIAGAISVVSGGISLYKKLTDDTEERLEYADRVSTLVAFDPVPFANLDEADKTILLEACIWRTLDAEDTSAYELNEIGAKYMPTSDIDKYVEELYGPDFHFDYQTFASNDLTYEYDADRKAFIVPITGLTANYYPEAVKIKREGNTRRVTIAYISSYSSGGGFTATPDTTPRKYYDYIFTQNGDGYYLTAIVESEMKVEATADSTGSSIPVVDAEDNQDLLNTATVSDSVAVQSTATDSTATSESVAS